MNYESVKSSNLSEVAYDRGTSTLGVRFKSGGEYEYLNVPEQVYRELISAPSVGSYFDANIKKAGYRFRQVR
ncbi:hypothetical protein BH10ACI4_BH10ACI4_38890 [soil metagenome]